MRILVFDPGDHTGWVLYQQWTGCAEITETEITGGTLQKANQYIELFNLIKDWEPEVIVFETFQLYPGKAASLAWSSFFTCEMIGIIKLAAALLNISLVAQLPSDKKFSGGLDELCPKGPGCTEHTKDAYMHLRFYLRKQKSKGQKLLNIFNLIK